MPERDAGWYADPRTPGDERYWDGERWTGQRRFSSFDDASPAIVRPGKSAKQRARQQALAEPEPIPYWKRRWVLVAAAVVVLIIVIWLFSRGDDQPTIDTDQIPGTFSLLLQLAS